MFLSWLEETAPIRKKVKALYIGPVILSLLLVIVSFSSVLVWGAGNVLADTGLLISIIQTGAIATSLALSIRTMVVPMETITGVTEKIAEGRLETPIP